VALASAEARRLGETPARGPIVAERTGTYVSAGVAYRF
jgi:outer membrane scaffolding protein for murein synthesis (MipA/OmpV family)